MSGEQARLRWRCRRGMRELDQLLGRWFDARYAQADAATRAAFASLLDEQDPQLWDWLSGRSEPASAAWRGLIDEIRNRHSV
jgi:antitoxin CptB